MNIKRILALLVAVALAVIAAVIFRVPDTTQTSASLQSGVPQTVDGTLAEAKAETDRVRKEFEKVRSDNDKLLAKLQELSASNQTLTAAAANVKEATASKEPGNVFAAMFGGGDGATNEMTSAIQKMVKAQMDQQLEAKMSRMKSRLNLIPDQESQIRDVLSQVNEKTIAVSQAFMGGHAKPEDLKDAAADSAAAPKTIESVLTPEQLTEYAALQKEELQGSARLMANAEMLQMQNTLGLTQEQQDKVFGVLYQQTLDTTSGNANPVSDAFSGGDPNSIAEFQKAIDKKVEGLKGILTPEQLKTYRETQEQQMKLIQAFMPKQSEPAPPTVVETPKP